MNTNSLDFGTIELGKSVSKLIVLKNDSNEAAMFQFTCEPKGVFSLNLANSQGVVPPKASTEVKVTFTPQDCMNYHKRVFCLVQNTDPLVKHCSPSH
jgi:hypothetical protein